MPDDAFRNLFSSVEAAGAALLITGPNAEAMNEALAAMNESAGATSAAFETIADTSAHKMQEAQNASTTCSQRRARSCCPLSRIRWVTSRWRLSF